MPSATQPANGGLVFIVDDDEAVSASMAMTLQLTGYEVHTYANAEAFLGEAKVDRPAALLVDFLMPGMTGLGLCKEVMARNLPVAFAVVSAHADVASAVEAMKLGAVDLMQKPFSHQRLLEVVHSTLKSALERDAQQRRQASSRQQLESLSKRERQVFEEMARGTLTKDIAHRLGISSRTVDVHRSRILQKLGIESPSQLASLLAAIDLQ